MCVCYIFHPPSCHYCDLSSTAAYRHVCQADVLLTLFTFVSQHHYIVRLLLPYALFYLCITSTVILRNVHIVLFFFAEESEFRNLVLWVEDQKIRHYTIDDRTPLRNISSTDWEKACKKVFLNFYGSWHYLTIYFCKRPLVCSIAC